MSNNRHTINDYDLVRPARLLDKGLPLPGLAGRYEVNEGWCAVITEGGVFKEILEPGTHFMNRYQFGRNVKAIEVDRRIKTLTVSTSREFTIATPVSVQIDLDLSVEYRVTDARRVALELDTPLTQLYDRVIEAVRGAVGYVTHEEARTQGEGIAQITLQRLKAMQLPNILGIEVLRVAVTRIRLLDTSGDAIATQGLKDFTTVDDWRVQQGILQGTRPTWEWLLMYRPEIAQQLIAVYGDTAKMLVEKGYIDPASELLTRTGSGVSVNPAGLLGNFGIPPIVLPGAQQNANVSQQRDAGQLPAGNDIHSRVREEIAYLKKLPGAEVKATAGRDDQGVADGTYDIAVTFPRTSGGHLSLFFRLGSDFPKSPPIDMQVQLDGQDQPFQSAILRGWAGQYLIEIAREAKQWFG